MTLRRTLLACFASAALPIAVAGAQLQGPIPREKEPPSQSQSRMKEKQLPLTITGCIRGKRLVLSSRSLIGTSAANLLNADELLLEGPKELMQQLDREHSDHEDELTGVAILKTPADGSSTTDIESKPLGKKVRITTGVRESSGPTGNTRQLVRFRVTGLQHLQEHCAGL